MWLVLIIIILVYLLLDYFSYEFERYERREIMLAKYIIFAILLMITVGSLHSNREYRKGVKCPELEKVENVYRIK